MDLALAEREGRARANFIQHHELHGGDPRRVRATYRVPALKLTVASWLRDLMRDTYGDPDVVLIPKGINFAQFHAPPRQRSNPPTVGVMTSPTAWKRTDLAFEAIRLAQKSFPQPRVLSFGSEAPPSGIARPANLEPAAPGAAGNRLAVLALRRLAGAIGLRRLRAARSGSGSVPLPRDLDSLRRSRGLRSRWPLGDISFPVATRRAWPSA